MSAGVALASHRRNRLTPVVFARTLCLEPLCDYLRCGLLAYLCNLPWLGSCSSRDWPSMFWRCLLLGRGLFATYATSDLPGPVALGAVMREWGLMLGVDPRVVLLATLLSQY